MLKGDIDRAMGAGFSHGAIRERSRHRFTSGKQLLTISTSGNSIRWFDEQGARISIRTMFSEDLAQSFSMARSNHLHLSNIAGSMTERHVREELYRVTVTARDVCIRLEPAICAPARTAAIS